MQSAISKYSPFWMKKTILIFEEHQEAPHMRKLQKTLADEVTRMVHSEEGCWLFKHQKSSLEKQLRHR